MLIRQNQLLGEATSFLDSIERLSLDEAAFTPFQVNVRHNQRLGQDLVQLESFLSFAQANGIDDAGFALHKVCEANEVPRDALAFLANEENLLADDELIETFSELKEAGFPVHVAAISDGSPYYLRLLEAISLDQAYDTYEDSPNLRSYVNESIIDDVKAKASSAASTVKEKASGGAKAVASKLASVRKEIAKKSSELLKATGPAKVFIKRQIDKLKSAAKELKVKLAGAKNSIGAKLSNAGQAVKDAASSVGSKVSGAVDSVKSGFSSVGNKLSDAASSVKSKASQGIDSIKAKFA